MPARLTAETGSGSWPTVRASDAEKGGRGDLIQAVRGNPTKEVSKSAPGLTPLDLAVRPEMQIHAERAKQQKKEPKQWPTPRNNTGPSIDAKHLSLDGAVRMFPTPQASDNRNRGNADTPAIAQRIAQGKQVMLTMTVVGGALNPVWVEWLMGWPLGWTSTEPMPQETWVAWLEAFRTDVRD